MIADGSGVMEVNTAGPSRPQRSSPPLTSEQTNDEEVDEEHLPQIPPVASPAAPRILLTTSPAATKATYQFIDELRGIFPGGTSYKRPKGRGYEVGRVARWAAKRGFTAMLVVNEDHKMPSEPDGSQGTSWFGLMSRRCYADAAAGWSNGIFQALDDRSQPPNICELFKYLVELH